MKLQSMVIALLLAVVFQSSLVTYISIGAFRPDLVVLVLVFFAARMGPFYGTVGGFAVGLIVDSLATGYLGLSSFSYSVAGFLIGKVFYTDTPLPLDRWAVASASGTLIAGMIFAYFYTLGLDPGFGKVLVQQVLPMVAYTWVLGMLWGISPLYERRKGMRLDS